MISRKAVEFQRKMIQWIHYPVDYIFGQSIGKYFIFNEKRREKTEFR